MKCRSSFVGAVAGRMVGFDKMCSWYPCIMVKKKHLSKEAIRNIKHKQMLWKTDILKVKKTIPFIEKHLTKLQLKLEIQREAMNIISFEKQVGRTIDQ